ncbi:hypothetical protein C8A00DRAFT_15731 [Chaetomidium leptoderma]|uniref:Uncharacterized protein n=1 Tax=Chaetomidium leptoderma TaxID=669021 RepID=A0AAN6VK38_9PEZI|nr:hypothetical protein C8A00DRAFT_15731 [Chaetomidium leptoderma]
MSFAPQFQTAGGFNFDTSARPGQPLHANIFRPPPSPSASSYNLAKSTGSLLSDISMSTAQHTGTAKRKRRTRESTPLDWHMNMEGAFDGREERSREFRYTLAGQISTTPIVPPVGAENGLLEDSVYSDVDYRRALGPTAVPEAESPTAGISASTMANPPALTGWSLFSLQTIGDMVGKVWEFCRNGAFRGFQAGGGQGYNVNGSTVTETTGKPWGPGPDTPIHASEDTPMTQEAPSYFPQQVPITYSPVYHDLDTPESTPQPAAKRRQVSANNDEALRNWVVVDEPSNQQPKRFAAEVKAAAARPSGLARPRPGYYAQTSASTQRRITAPSSRFTGGTPTLPRAATRPSLRIPHAGSPNVTPREPAREPESFASPRSSPIGRSTPSRIPLGLSTGSAHRRNHSSVASSASAGAGTAINRRHSTVPTRPQDVAAAATTSPRLDAEARQLAQRKMAAERDADAKVDAFNARLLNMIRQGREALGTKVEVEMADEMDFGGGGGVGGGWEDDD